MLEAGDSLFPDDPLFPEEVTQRKLKAELVMAANKAMGVDFATVGDQDLRLGVEYLKSLAAETQFPLHSANLLGADGKTVFPARAVKTIAGVKVGLFGLTVALDAEGRSLLEDNPNYKLADPFEAARREVAALQKEGAHVIVAVTHLGITDDTRLANEVPGIHFIFGGHSMSPLAEPSKSKDTWILQSGSRGKHVGRLDLDLKGADPVAALASLTDVSSLDRVRGRIEHYNGEVAALKDRVAKEPDPDRKRMIQDQIDFYQEQLAIETKNLPANAESASSLRNELVELSRDIADEPKVAKLVADALAKMAELPAVPVTTTTELVATGKGPYVGASVCQGCHVPQYQQWTTTAHAKAFKTLQDELHAADFDCVGCHSTGYKKDGGPNDPFTLGGLVHVQCEACHGPGRKHAEAPKDAKLVTKFDEASCRTCHSVEQTGDRFVFSEYLPKVVHTNAAKKAEAPK